MSSQTFLPDIQWIARKATEDPDFVFQRMAHHLDEELLEEAFHRLRKDAAPGIEAIRRIVGVSRGHNQAIKPFPIHEFHGESPSAVTFPYG